MIPDCSCNNPDCGKKIVWQEGKRFVYECGNLSSTDAYLVQELGEIKRLLHMLLLSNVTTNISHLVP